MENKAVSSGFEGLRIVTRDEWLAEPPAHPLDNMTINPVDKVIIAHTVTAECKTQAECSTRVRAMQVFHMATKKFDDIAYNFLVGGDGLVYEGRGWTKGGAHTPST